MGELEAEVLEMVEALRALRPKLNRERVKLRRRGSAENLFQLRAESVEEYALRYRLLSAEQRALVSHWEHVRDLVAQVDLCLNTLTSGEGDVSRALTLTRHLVGSAGSDFAKTDAGCCET